MSDAPIKLPDIATVSLGASLGWLAKGWRDFLSAPIQCLIYGILLTGASAAIATLLYLGGALNSILILLGGFLLLGPVIGMGLYEAGRQLELGQTPSVRSMVLVKSALRPDLAYLGLALFLIYEFWVGIAHIVYGLSTSRLYKTPQEFLTFMFTDPSGQMMAGIGTLIGGAIAFLAFTLVVVSAPMLLDRKTDVFIATVTSVRAVLSNKAAMLVWAMLIVCLIGLGIATAFIGLIVIFPVIGLASWHAYRELVPASPQPTAK